jgi:hypothetical protein
MLGQKRDDECLILPAFRSATPCFASKVTIACLDELKTIRLQRKQQFPRGITTILNTYSLPTLGG